MIVHGAFSSPEIYQQTVARMDLCADLQYVTEVQWQRYATRLYRLLPPREGFVVK